MALPHLEQMSCATATVFTTETGKMHIISGDCLGAEDVDDVEIDSATCNN